MPIADCGHKYERPEGGTGPAGYAVVRIPRTVPGQDRSIMAGGKVCYGCSYELELADLKVSDDVFGYLSGDGRTITTWTGDQLMTVVNRKVVERCTPTGGYNSVHYLTARDLDGFLWHGQGSGRGMSVRMRLYASESRRRNSLRSTRSAG